MKKVTLTIVVRDQHEANYVANEMENSPLAQEGLYTLVCGDIEDCKHWEEQEVKQQLDGIVEFDDEY